MVGGAGVGVDVGAIWVLVAKMTTEVATIGRVGTAVTITAGRVGCAVAVTITGAAVGLGALLFGGAPPKIRPRNTSRIRKPAIFRYWRQPRRRGGLAYPLEH